MNLKELQSNAKAILKLSIPVEGYENISFTTLSGGAPENRVNIPEINRNNSFKYSTTSCGDAYKGEVVICCRNTGTKDYKDREIYITPDGVVFTFSYVSGDPSSFDCGALVAPYFK